MNLFEKYGGADFWSDFLNTVYENLTASKYTRHHFRSKNISHIKEMLLALLELTLASNTEISELAMREAHRDLGISNEEFDEWISIYRQALNDYKVAEPDCVYIIDILSSYRRAVVRYI